MATLADPIEPLPYRVVEVRTETIDVVTVVVAPVATVLPVARPGQFMLVWAFGVGEIPVSVSGMEHGDHVMLTVRSVGHVSAAVVGVHVGDLMGLRGPFGTEWPIAEAAGHDVVVVAGGLGCAPLRMAIDELVAADASRVTVSRRTHLMSSTHTTGSSRTPRPRSRHRLIPPARTCTSPSTPPIAAGVEVSALRRRWSNAFARRSAWRSCAALS